MKKNQLLLLIALSISTSIFAQIKKSKDIAAIKKMCGCFEVTFNFSETFNYSDDSLYIPSKNKTDRALELALLIKDENNELSIQHLLQMGDNDNAYIVKHWRQDWQFQNKDFYMFNGDNNWLYVNKPYKEVRNQWSQKVYQVDDSPRYEGSSSWVHVDGKSYWENTTDAPLPRRERTKRSDYNVTERGSRVEIMDYGWLHDQDNRKIIRTDSADDFTLAKEKGYNTYKRVNDDRCLGAANWWKENYDKWEIVRQKWYQVYSKNQDLSLHGKVDNKRLYEYLFSEDYSIKETIDSTIDSFVK